jgi:hypothetical protein
MPKATFTKHFDYQEKFGKPMTSYPKGYSGDIPQSHYDKAAELGVLDNDTAPADSSDKPLGNMTKAELEATAQAEGVDISSAANNDERVTLIQQARDSK